MAALALAAVLLATACGGDDDDDGESASDETPVASAQATSGVTPTTTNTGGATPGTGSTLEPIATGSSVSAGKTFTIEQAQMIVDTVPLAPEDLPSVWNIGTDTTTDAATAAANNPENAASIERCGNLLSTLQVLAPPMEDLTSRYIGGEQVSYFTNLTVYATDEGATDCANEAAAEFTSDPMALAEAFGSVFVDPAAVVITPVEFPQVGEGSFATNLTGTVSAGGFEVSITILIVAWRQGNVSAVVGSAASFDPPPDDLHQYVELVAERIADAQG